MNENKNLSHTGLTQEIVTQLQKIFNQYPAVKQVKIYGSRVKGTYKNNSDIDLVLYGEDLNSFLVADIIFAIEDSPIPYLVDIQIYSKIVNKQLQDHIDRLGVLVYEQ
jgi:predicted nucleotidyltransferase